MFEGMSGMEGIGTTVQGQGMLTSAGSAGSAAGSSAGGAGGFMQMLGPLLSMFGGGQGAKPGQTVDRGSSNWGPDSQNMLRLSSWLGAVASSIAPKDSPAGRLGATMSERANGGLTALAQIEREKGQRQFLSDLLKAHKDTSKSTDEALSSKTPEQVGGGISNWFTDGRI